MSTLTAAEHRRQAESYLEAAEDLRGRNFTESLALALIGLGHAILAERTPPAGGGDVVTCPSCRQRVTFDADVCPACGATCAPPF